MRHLWLDAGDDGRGKGSDWVETTVGRTGPVLRAVHRFKRSWVPNEPPQGPDRLVALPAGARVPRAPQEMGGRAHLRLVTVQPPPAPRL
jgi:hypothetical protein